MFEIVYAKKVEKRCSIAWMTRATIELERTEMRIGSIVIHCHEFERTVAFWQDALDYVPRRPAKDGWVVLKDPNGNGPNLSFQLRESSRAHRNWVHLDLYANNQDEDVERLLQLGAKRYPWRYRPGSDFVVLEDPDGNLFCVVQRPQ